MNSFTIALCLIVCHGIQSCISFFDGATTAQAAFLSAPLRKPVSGAGSHISLKHVGKRPGRLWGLTMGPSSDKSAEALSNVKSQIDKKQLSGMPISPVAAENDGSVGASGVPPVIVRYMYDGGLIGQGKLCWLHPADSSAATGAELADALREDGVDLEKFYPCAYEWRDSSGGWLSLEPNPDAAETSVGDGKGVTFPLPPPGGVEGTARRIDVKLLRRPTKAGDGDDGDVKGNVPVGGYFGIGIINPKTEENVGTLWRSAYQLGASMIYTIGARYRPSSTDTLNVPARVPLFELDDWSAFAAWAPKGARWIAVEMGGTPLAEFEHPRNAVYVLGSEDHGVPKSVVRACHEVVSLDSAKYASYNVAVAGSIVMYDRLAKMKGKES